MSEKIKRIRFYYSARVVLCHLSPLTEKLLSRYKVKGFSSLFGLFRIHLLSRDDIYSLYRGRFYVWASRLCLL